MKLTLDIQNQKALFFLELLESLSEFVKVETATDLPQNGALQKWQKDLLEERLAKLTSNPTDLLDWEDVRRDLEKMLA